MKSVKAVPLTSENFKPFGSVIEKPQHHQGYIETKYVQFWNDIVDLSNLQDQGMICFLKVKNVPFVIESLEMLPHSMEAYISLDGKSSIIAVAPSDSATGKPQVDKLEAFIIDGGVSPVIAPGIWHWNPFPISKSADFAVVIRRNLIIKQYGKFTINPQEVLVENFAPVSITL